MADDPVGRMAGKCALLALWLFSCLYDILDPEPIHLSDSDGDDLLFHDVRFPLARGVAQARLAARLAQVADLETSGPRVWTWLQWRRQLSMTIFASARL